MGRYSRLREISPYEFPWDYAHGVSIAFLRDHGVPRISQLLDTTRAFETFEKLLDEPCCTRWGSGSSHTGYGSQPSAPSGHAPSSYAYCPRGRTVGPRFPNPGRIPSVTPSTTWGPTGRRAVRCGR